MVVGQHWAPSWQTSQTFRPAGSSWDVTVTNSPTFSAMHESGLHADHAPKQANHGKEKNYRDTHHTRFSQHPLTFSTDGGLLTIVDRLPLRPSQARSRAKAYRSCHARRTGSRWTISSGEPSELPNKCIRPQTKLRRVTVKQRSWGELKSHGDSSRARVGVGLACAPD